MRKVMDVFSLFSPDRKQLGTLEAATLLDWPKGTTSRILNRMRRHGLLDRDEPLGRYRIGIRLAELGELARQSTSLQQQTQSALEQLRAETGETASLAVLAGSQAMDIAVVEGSRYVKPSDRVGARFPVHATASGKALVAWVSDEQLKQIVVRPLERLTSATITNLNVLRRELAQVRTRGYAVVRGEFYLDLAAIAAPVRDYRGAVVAAIAIGAPISRVSEAAVPKLARSVVAAAATASAALGHRDLDPAPPPRRRRR